jgi:thioredoxin-like negative regulator of GroEL
MKDFTDLTTLEELQQLEADGSPAILYFSHQQCNVCKVLKPKIREMIENNFPQMMLYYVNTREHPDMAGQYSVFTVPTILVFFEGREYIRESRHISITAFQERLEKLYRIYYQ